MRNESGSAERHRGRQMEDELAERLKGIEGMDRIEEDYGLHIQLWEDIMDHVGSVNCAWEQTQRAKQAWVKHY